MSCDIYARRYPYIDASLWTGSVSPGVCTAYFLRMAGFNVTVVDARPSPLASSSSSSSSSPLPSLSSHLPSEASVQSESGLVGTMAATSMVRPALARNMMLGGPHFFYSLAVNLFGLDPTNRRVGLWAWLCRTMEKLGGPEDETEAFEKQMLYHGLPNFYAKVGGDRPRPVFTRDRERESSHLDESNGNLM